jgi:hypothetical protein
VMGKTRVRARHLPLEDRVLLESVSYMAERGFHAETIARSTGLTKSQVSYRVAALGLRLRSYRDGTSTAAKELIAVTPCVEVGVHAVKGETYKVREYLKKE